MVDFEQGSLLQTGIQMSRGCVLEHPKLPKGIYVYLYDSLVKSQVQRLDTWVQKGNAPEAPSPNEMSYDWILQVKIYTFELNMSTIDFRKQSSDGRP